MSEGIFSEGSLAFFGATFHAFLSPGPKIGDLDCGELRLKRALTRSNGFRCDVCIRNWVSLVDIEQPER